MSHNGDWRDSLNNGFGDVEMHTGAIWLQKNGIAAALLLGEVAKTVLFSTDQFIYTGVISGIIKNYPNKTLQRKKGTHTYITLL